MIMKKAKLEDLDQTHQEDTQGAGQILNHLQSLSQDMYLQNVIKEKHHQIESI